MAENGKGNGSNGCPVTGTGAQAEAEARKRISNRHWWPKSQQWHTSPFAAWLVCRFRTYLSRQVLAYALPRTFLPEMITVP